MLQGIKAHLDGVDQLCVPSAAKRDELLASAKALFDHAASSANRSFGPFDELLVEGMDAESVWEELRSRNGPLTKFLKKKATGLIKTLQRHEARSAELEEGGSADEEEGEEDEEDEEDDEEDEEEDEEGGGAFQGQGFDDDSDFDEDGADDYRGSDEEEEEEHEQEHEQDDMDVEEEEDDRSVDPETQTYDSDGMEAWLDEQEEVRSAAAAAAAGCNVSAI